MIHLVSYNHRNRISPDAVQDQDDCERMRPDRARPEGNFCLCQVRALRVNFCCQTQVCVIQRLLVISGVFLVIFHVLASFTILDDLVYYDRDLTMPCDSSQIFVVESARSVRANRSEKSS